MLNITDFTNGLFDECIGRGVGRWTSAGFLYYHSVCQLCSFTKVKMQRQSEGSNVKILTVQVQYNSVERNEVVRQNERSQHAGCLPQRILCV